MLQERLVWLVVAAALRMYQCWRGRAWEDASLGVNGTRSCRSQPSGTTTQQARADRQVIEYIELICSNWIPSQRYKCSLAKRQGTISHKLHNRYLLKRQSNQQSLESNAQPLSNRRRSFQISSVNALNLAIIHSNYILYSMITHNESCSRRPCCVYVQMLRLLVNRRCLLVSRS